jgi:hypothetical protein
MDIVFWIILVVVIAAVILWLLNRNKSAGTSSASAAGTRSDRPRSDGALEGGSAAASAEAAGTTGIPTAAGFGRPAEPAAPATAEEPLDSSASSTGQDQADQARAEDQAEWETQWSEAGSGPRSGSSATGEAAAPLAASDAGTRDEAAATATAPAPASPEQEAQSAARPAHHDEYTAPHAPTLPGAESAAVESADDDGGAAAEPAGGPASQHRAETPASPASQEAAAPQVSYGLRGDAAETETLDRTQSSALVENGADHNQPSGQEDGITATAPAGHLAADEPYGAGSAAAGPDGSGPVDYTVKGDASEMVYYEEGHPDYEQTRAEVWFESAAHAEAAGFRAPRRKRLY